MLTPSIKSKVNELWNKFWSGGITNPLTAIEQITYLLFMKQLDENDVARKSNSSIKGQKYISIFSGLYFPPGTNKKNKKKGIKKSELRWSNVNKGTAEQIFTKMQASVFPFIKELGTTDSSFALHMRNAVFLIPKASLLKDVMDTIDELYQEIKAEDRFLDTQGDVYEYLLSQLSTAGKNGQFRTPTHIIELIVELVSPKLGDKIADPACGTAGFLLGALKFIITSYTSKEYIKRDDNGFLRSNIGDKLKTLKDKDRLQTETFFGYDIDATMIRLGLMNLMMHGIDNPQINYKDTLGKLYNEDGVYDVVLANPPFAGSLDKGEINKSFTINTTKTELLFIERIYRMLKKGGTAGVIVPQGVLFGVSKAVVETRKILVDQCNLKAVISMPSGVFKPYAGVATAILIFTKGSPTDKVWFYDMQQDGWSLDDKRNELYKSNGDRDFGDLHEIIKEFGKTKKNNDRSKPHFIIPKKEIVSRKYDLSVNKYRKKTYKEIQFEDPKIILDRLSSIETEIQKEIKVLKTITK